MPNSIANLGVMAAQAQGIGREIIAPSLDSIRPPGAADGSGSEVSFGRVLSDAIGRVEGYRAGSENAMKSFLSGEEHDLHKVAMATQQAEVSLELFLQVKNKVVQAYQEIMRMQV
jgi:flagellar hook-basal body complex protein FliE